MLYDISQYFGWIAAAFLLGAVVGWLTYADAHGKYLAGWFKWGAGLFVLGIIVALFHLLPGLFGLYLETALLLFGGYIIGGHVGAWLKSLTADHSSNTSSTPSSTTTKPGSTSASLTGKVGATVAGGAALAATVAKSAAGTAASTVADNAVGLAAKAGDVVGAVTGGATGAVSSVTGAATDAVSGLAAKAGDVAGAVTGGAAGAVSSVTGAATDAVSGLAAKAGDVAGAVTGGTSGAVSSVTGAATDAVSGLTAKAGDVAGAVTVAAGERSISTSRQENAASLETSALQYSAPTASTAPTSLTSRQENAPSPESSILHNNATNDSSTLATKAGGVAGTVTASAQDFSTSQLENTASLETSALQYSAPTASTAPTFLTSYQENAASPETSIPHDSAISAASGLTAKAGEAAAAVMGGAALAGAATAAKTTPSVAIIPGEQPPTLAAPMGGKADDLKLIKGIGPKNEAVLNGLGYHHFSQIAAWTAPQEEWIGHKMAFPGRIEREHWVPQAKSLAAGIETDHARAVKAGLKVEDSAEDHAASALATVTFRHEKAASSATPTLHYGAHHALVTPSDSHLPGAAPSMQVHPDKGQGDDLTQIKGIGPVNQSVLNGLGIHHFHQIAAWTPDNATWMGHKMAFPGRIEREEWVPQAQQLALGHPAPAPEAADPAPAPELPNEHAHEGKRPPGFVAPRAGKGDDLKRIRGIGPQNEERLQSLGVWHFDQIANWNHEQVRWVGSYLAFPGRIDREEWVPQAKVLASEVGTREKSSRG